MREHLFQLPDNATSSLQAQVREMLVSAILDGHLPPGRALPSCRKLATQLGIARNTVVLAYQHLVDEGYLISRERSGFYVDPGILEGRLSASTQDAHAPPVDRAAVSAFAPAWRARLQVEATALASPNRPSDWQRYDYPFVYGQIDPALFPIAEWRECCREALSVRAIRQWAHDHIDTDDPDLVEQLQTRVLPRRGVWAKPEQILVTLGAQQALYLLAALLMGDRDTVGIENPGYADARNILQMHAGKLVPIPVDSQGLRVSASLRGCDYLYVTPSHQCPTTVTMPLTRRRALLDSAREHDFIIIEDDYEAENNYAGPPTPALKSLDADGRVIYVGSLSKTLAPGLRLGFMVGPEELVREARALRRFMLRHPPSNNERSLALFLSRGHHDALVRRLSHAFRERCQVMGEALRRHLPQASYVPTVGGTSYWVQGPDNLNVAGLLPEARREGVLVEPGDVFFAAPEQHQNYFRLGFSAIPTQAIEPGIVRLAALLRRCT
ncbi:MAG: PLP-dependent aminotransferase family protein [Pseudomonadota bacterium]